MKKTLIALAALAATASFAQSSVTLSGKFGTSYQAPMGGKSNIAVSDGDINFAAVEDLGGGLKAGANMALRLRGRENTASATVAAQTTASGASSATAANQTYAKTAYSEVGRDGTVYLSGGFGTLTAGSIELGNGITGRGWGGTNLTLPTDVNNGGLLSANAYGNILQYTAPAFNGFTVSVVRADSIASVGLSDTNVAASGAETNRGLTANVVSLAYANGPFTAGIDSTTFGKLTSAGAAYDGKRTRFSADYDFGFAKVGFGQEDNKGTSRDTAAGKQTTYGISAPFGAIRAGVIYAKSTESTATGTATGLAADYSFSKRTVLNVSYAKIDRTDSTDTTKEGKQYRVRLMHSF